MDKAIRQKMNPRITGSDNYSDHVKKYIERKTNKHKQK